MVNPTPVPACPTKTQQDTNDDCDKLLSLLDPVVVNAVADPNHWRHLDPIILKWLIGLREYPWFNHLALAAVIHARSGVVCPTARLYEMQSFLRWAIPEHYPTLTALQPEPALADFFGNPPDIRGKGAVSAYHGLQLHAERYLALLPTQKRAAVTPFLFPPLVISRRLTTLTSHATERTQTARKKLAFGVIKRLPELVALARQRYYWLAQLESQFQLIVESFKQEQTKLPVEIKLPGWEGQPEMRFRVWDQNSWVLAHSEGYCESVLYYARYHKYVDKYFVQLVGELPEKPWFLRAVALGGLQGPHRPPPEAAHYLRKWGIRDFMSSERGLLVAGHGVAYTMTFARRHATGTPEDSRILFRPEPLLAAAALSLFAVVSIASTGMRLGELQQVELDRDCMETLALPEFDDQTGKWTQGTKRIYWRLFPKGRNQRERYLVTPYMNEALFILLDLHKRYHNEMSLTPVAPNYRHFSRARHFPGKHKFVLQWGGWHVSQQGLTRCIKFLLFEHDCRDEAGNPINITSHILRHATAGWLRQRGMPLEEIMVLLKHVNITVTDYYSQRSPDDLYEKMGPALTALAELVGCDPTTIRSPDAVRNLAQEALKQFGVLRHVPGGQCGTFDPCMVHFACATCHHFVPDATRRCEVETKVALCERIEAMRRKAGDYIEADTEHSRKRDWERILKEMDGLAQVPLMAAPISEDFKNVAGSDFANLFPLQPENLGLNSGGDQNEHT